MVGQSLHYFLTVFVVHCFNVHIAGLSVRRTPSSSMKSSTILGNTFQYQIGSRLSEVYMAADEGRAVVKSSYSDNLSVLMSKTKDRVSVNIAIVNIMKDPEFIKKSNALSIISDALKNCRVPSHHMLFYWKEAVYFGAPVKKQDLRDLLFYCFNFGKGDTLTLQNAIDTVCKFNRLKYWNAALVNLIIQIYSERLDSVYDKRNAVEKGFALSEIIRDLMMLKEKILDEKSIVMLLKYFSNIEDYETLKSVFLYRDTAIKRSITIADNKIDGTGGIGGSEGGDNIEGQENSIIYNVYLSSLIKFSLKEQNSDENVYIEEAYALVENMLLSKSADFYTLNTMLEYYALKINKYNRIKGDNYTVKVEKTVKKCFELWNQKFFTLLRENAIKNKSLEEIPRGIKISYSIILKCLLLSVDDDNKKMKLNEIKNVNDNGKDKDNENIIIDKKDKKVKNQSIEHIVIDKNENKKNDYMAIAFRLTLEMPCEEAITSVLFSLGKSETECTVAIQYMHLLNRKKKSLLMNKSKNNNHNNDNNSSNDDVKFSTKEENNLEIQENEDKNKNGNNENNENERSGPNNELFDMSETNHIDSLLGGYYDSYRHDLVIQAYLTAYNNNQPFQSSNSYLNSDLNINLKTIKNEKFNPYKISNMNIKGNTRAFNLFMASLKEIIETESLAINKKMLDKSIKHKQLWEFSKTVLIERMAAEKNRVMKIQNIQNNDTINSDNKNIVSVDNNNNDNNKNNINKNNNNKDNDNKDNDNKNFKSDKTQEIKRITVIGKEMDGDMSENDPYLDAYTIASSIDVANIFPDMIMAKELFYTHHNINTNIPSQRVVQSFLRSFQLPSHLYELDQFMNNVLVKSTKYKNLFTVNRYDYTGNNVKDGEELRTFDEILNAYKRVGNLPIALEIAANHYNKFSEVSLENLLIHFSRYWRDYENESIGIIDLLKGQERLERRYNNEMNDFREANLQSRSPPIKKDYYSIEAEAYVRTPSVYVQLHETTGRCLSVEAGILADILCARSVQGTPSYVFWSALVGVLLSRGEKDTAIDILLKMENIDDNNILLDNKNKLNKIKNDINNYNSNKNNNKNDNNDVNINMNMNDINENYKKNFGINKPKINKNKKPYKGQEIAQTVELGILYALDSSLPLLTKNGEKALVAMNLIRLLPKQENSNLMKQNNIYNVKDMKVNGNNKSLTQSQSQSQSQSLNQNQNQNNNEKINDRVGSKKIHNLDGISEILDRIPKELRLNSAEKRTVCAIGDVLEFLESCRGRDSNYSENNDDNDYGIGVKIEKMMNENNQNDQNKKNKSIISDLNSYNNNYNDNNNNNNDNDDDYNLDDDYSASLYVQQHNKVRTDKVRTDKDKDKVPVGIALLQSLFGDAINDKKYSQAARIIRLLEGSRLVIDLDAPSLAAVSSSSSSSSLPLPLSLPLSLPLPLSNIHQNQEHTSDDLVQVSDIDLETSPPPSSSTQSSLNDNNNLKLNNDDFINTIIENPNKESAVKIVRETLARKWAAMLIASSLNKLKSNVAGSVKMLAALQYLQKDEIKPLD